MINLLNESKVFKDCTSQELVDITNIAQKMTFSGNQTIFEKGTPAKYLYIVLQGAIELRFDVTYYEAKREITIDSKSGGEAFGWSSFVQPNIYTLTAVALGDTELMKINNEDLIALCMKNHHMGFIVMHNIAEIAADRYNTVMKMLIGAIQQQLKEKEG